MAPLTLPVTYMRCKRCGACSVGLLESDMSVPCLFAERGGDWCLDAIRAAATLGGIDAAYELMRSLDLR